MMPADRQNAISDLVDLRLRLRRSEIDQETFFVHSELRIGTAEVNDDEGITFKVAVKRLIVGLEMDGVDVEPGSRFGEPVRTSGPTVKASHRSESSTTAKIDGRALLKVSETGIPSGGASSEVKGSKELKDTVVKETQVEIQDHHVVARGGDRWEVIDRVKDRLDGTYLSDEQALCCLKSSKGANRRAATLVAEIAQRDLIFDMSETGAFRKLSTTQKKLIGILIAKCAHISADSQYAGKIRVSRSESEVED